MKATSFLFFIFFFSLLANAQPCGLTLVTLYTYTAGCSVCNDTIVVAGIGGNGTLTYSWSDGQTDDTAVGLCPGTYTCTVIDTANCTSTGIFTLTSTPNVQVTASYLDASCESCCDGIGIANAFSGTSPYTYLWSDNSTNDTAFGLCPGKYFVCVTDANGCATCDSIEVGFVSGIDVVFGNDLVSVFPNPSTDGHFIFSGWEKLNVLEVHLYNLLGEEIQTVILPREFAGTIDVPYPGVYFVVMETKDGPLVKRLIW